MSKVPLILENPIDIYFIRLSERVSKDIKEYTNYTANDITSISTISGFLSLHFLNEKNILGFLLLYIFYYFTDCLDGYFARKYAQVSKFGDFYDHVKDFIIGIIFIYILIKNYKNKVNIYLLILFVFMFLMMMANVICSQQFYIKKEEPKESLDFISKYFCVDKNLIKYTRYFGCGTFISFQIFVVFYLTYTST